MKSKFLHFASIIVMAVIGSAVAGDPPEDRTADPTPHRTLLIVHTEPLASAAQAWAEYRRSARGGSWRVILHAVALDGHPTARQEAIRRVIRATWRDSNSPTDSDFAVMLLGDTEANTMSALPAWYFPQRDTVMRSGDGRNDQFATDLPYQLMDDADASPDIMLGRVPARHVDEAMAALRKIMRYEQPPTIEELVAGNRTRIAYTAGEGHFGPMDGMLEELFKMMVDRIVPDAFDMNMIYAKPSSIYCPPPSQVTEAVLDQLDSGALLFNYIGHGFETGFDSLYWRGRHRILTTMDLFERAEKQSADVANDTDHSANQVSSAISATSADRLRPIAFLSCCSTGCFDISNGQRSMAEELFFNSGGAVAVIAGSRITHPYANTVMQMNITKSLLVDREPTVGLLDLRADQAMLKRTALDRQLDSIAAPIARAGKWETSLRDLREMHVKLYNLIGDPAMCLALPSCQIANLKFENDTIMGEIPTMKTGRVVVTFEVQRTSMAHPERVQTPVGENDPDLEAKAANNFALVNQRVLVRLEGEVEDGRFSLVMNDDVPPRTALLRAIAIGFDESGTARDAVGAIRIQPMTPSGERP